MITADFQRWYVALSTTETNQTVFDFLCKTTLQSIVFRAFLSWAWGLVCIFSATSVCLGFHSSLLSQQTLACKMLKQSVVTWIIHQIWMLVHISNPSAFQKCILWRLLADIQSSLLCACPHDFNWHISNHLHFHLILFSSLFLLAHDPAAALSETLFTNIITLRTPTSSTGYKHRVLPWCRCVTTINPGSERAKRWLVPNNVKWKHHERSMAWTWYTQQCQTVAPLN